MNDTILDPVRIVRRIVGRRHMIARSEMRSILLAYHAAGGSLYNDCLVGTVRLPGDDRYTETELRDRAITAWVGRCDGITCVSVHAAAAVPHGDIRFDEPGRMHPLQRCDVMFVADSLDSDCVRQLRPRSRRLLVVRSGPVPPEIRLDISICPTEMEVGDHGDLLDEDKVFEAIRAAAERKWPGSRIYTSIQVGYQQGVAWSRCWVNDEPDHDLAHDLLGDMDWSDEGLYLDDEGDE